MGSHLPRTVSFGGELRLKSERKLSSTHYKDGISSSQLSEGPLRSGDSLTLGVFVGNGPGWVGE